MGAVIFIGISLILISFYMQARAYKSAAIDFWGDLYNPDEKQVIDWGLIGNLVIPKGGPIISRDYAGICPDTELPVVPIRYDASGRIQVLCGFGSDTIVMGFNLEHQDEQFKSVLRDAIKEDLK
ncbi:hypothetical protein EZI54_07100 [Marinobacter halodurans]|uniref:Uncharacterized protein n=1 Tax=Marinobacter halodurans TaxID=2528979 RepID=A0ABY1ZMD7_9GAMM|nr:hypothetical protein [Marinobacter halodurans]TBW57418.1 hypothetical protein EZI54_07100 [Marinobacter halodurans]